MPRLRPSAPAARRSPKLRLSPRHPPVSLADLALMLEIDLHFGRRRDFVSRLRRALQAASRQGFAPRNPAGKD